MITAVSGELLKVFGMDLLMIEIVNNIIEPVSVGLYLYTTQAGEFRQTKKMVLLK